MFGIPAALVVLLILGALAAGLVPACWLLLELRRLVAECESATPSASNRNTRGCAKSAGRLPEARHHCGPPVNARQRCQRESST
jgi:hypothetical protein